MASTIFPQYPIGSLEGATPAFVFSTLNAADETTGVICNAPKSGDVVSIWFATRNVTTGATCEGRIETVSAGIPSGSLYGTNTNGNVVIANGDDNVIKEVTLTSAASVVAGDSIAVLVKNPNTSFGNLQIACAPASQNNTRLPYGVENVSGSYLPFTLDPPPTLALEYDDGSIERIDEVNPPASALSTTIFNTGTTPDVAGLRFEFETDTVVSGAWFWMDLDGDAKVCLVDAAWDGTDGDCLALVTLAATTRSATTPGVYRVRFPYVTLSAGTPYRLVLVPTSVTSVRIYDFTTASIALMGAWADSFCLTTAKDPNDDTDWTNYNSGTFRQPYMGLVVEGLDIATGPPPSSGGISRSRVQRRM